MHKAVKIHRARKGDADMRPRSTILSVVALACLLSLCRLAGAETISVTSLSLNPAAGIYTYTVTVDNNAIVTTGNGFVIYDISGFIGSSLSMPGLPGAFSPTTSTYGNAVSNSAYNPPTQPGPTFSSSLGAITPAAGNNLDMAAGTSGTNGFTNLSYSYSGPTISSSTYIGILTITAAPTNGNAISPVESFDSSGAIDSSNVYVPGNPTFGSTPVALPASFWGGGVLMSLLLSAGLAKKLRLAREGLN
jgi:hypothetical protein